jgi:hypothetical protein
MLSRLDQASADMAAVEAQIEAAIGPFAQAVDQLDELCGVGRAAAQVLIAEIGIDMGRFPTAGQLVSWARFAPGVKESAGNRKGKATPATATRSWPGCWARPRWPPGGPTPSWGSAIGASPAGAVPSGPSWRSAAPS